jgi:hypothetical protein
MQSTTIMQTLDSGSKTTWRSVTDVRGIRARRVITTTLCAVAVYHAWHVCNAFTKHGIAVPLWRSAEASPPLANGTAARHLLFVLINAALALATRYRPRVAVALLVPLTAQQLWSHGGDLLRARATQPATWDLPSVAVLTMLAVIWAAIGQSAWRTRTE